MTTPERLRRRQRIEGAFIVVIGVLLVVSTLWFRHQDDEQRACIGENFADMSAALEARGLLAERETDLNRREARAQFAESKANRVFYRDAFASTTEADIFEAYGDYRARLERIDRTRAEIKAERQAVNKERKDNPIPAFPRGACDA